MNNIITLWSANINDILVVQNKIEEELSNLFKWEELFFTNTQEEFLEIFSNPSNLWKWIYNDKELVAYWIIVKDISYKQYTLLSFNGVNGAQIDIIAVNPKFW